MKYAVIVTGTDPESRRGGIGFALPGYLAAMDSARIEYTSIPTYHPISFGGSWLMWLRALPNIARRIRAIKKDGKSVIVYSHPGAGVSLFREGVVLAMAQFCGAATLMQLHALEVDEYLKSPWKKWAFWIVVGPASGLAVLTPWWRQRLKDHRIGKPLFVIPNPLPPAWEKITFTRRRKKTSEEPFTVLTLTRLEPGKGVDLVIEAMKFLDEKIRLVIGGEGSLRQSLETRVLHLGIQDRVLFAGWVKGREKGRLLESADIFCLPTSYDSFGMGFLEAMAYGLPVIALDFGPVADVVCDGRSGLLLNGKSPEGLAKLIARLVDSETRKRMGMNGQAWVMEKFSSAIVGTQLKSAFEALIIGRR
ncbi:MAG TPA: glycosyltransferase family 1 protein [Gammaproteobacteria bacterium]|nr:glycosyltransferase family 1 protein [Gammaproteobacteria bacterium]